MATIEDIATLRRITNEPGIEFYTDESLGLYLDDLLSMDSAASVIWQEKAARASNLVNVSESGSSRSNQQIYANALDQAKFYAGRVTTEVVADADVAPFTTPIERQ